jgi:hypothetical protein
VWRHVWRMTREEEGGEKVTHVGTIHSFAGGGCSPHPLLATSSCLQSNWDEVVDNFDDMNLREELLRGIYAYGFEKPSAIQQRAIVPCIKGEMSSPSLALPLRPAQHASATCLECI